MRLIDADELIKHFKNQEVEGMNLAIDLYAIGCINNAPTIDPVRHGEWVATDDPWFSACSVCGYIEYECVGSNYCPECGTKMDGGTDNEID